MQCSLSLPFINHMAEVQAVGVCLPLPRYNRIYSASGMPSKALTAIVNQDDVWSMGDQSHLQHPLTFQNV